MPNVTSTLSTSMSYDFHERLPGGELIVKESIIIAGGAHVASKNLITTDGVVTQITDKQAEMLKEHPVFKRHQERGFVKIHRGHNADTKGLEDKDASAPLDKDECRKRGFAAPLA